MLSIRLNAHLKEPSLQENLVNLNVHVCIISIYQLYFDWAEEAESHPLKLLKMNSVKTLAFFCHKLTLNTKNLPLIYQSTSACTCYTQCNSLQILTKNQNLASFRHTWTTRIYQPIGVRKPYDKNFLIT